MFSVTLTTDNDAFSDSESMEVARILRDAAARIESGEMRGNLRDVNGNTVGAFSFDA